MSYFTNVRGIPVASEIAAMSERDQIIAYLLQTSDAKNKAIEDLHAQIADLQEKLAKNAAQSARKKFQENVVVA